MDHDEPALDLSDVVHDEPMGDEDPIPSEDEPQSPFPTTSITPLHEPYDTTPISNHLSAAEPFSVEMLEREIATLLNQNASAASAALISAAAQQRQANMDHENNMLNSRDDETVGGLGLNLTGLAAVLQAAHAQAAENERLSEALAAKDPVYARQREAALARQTAEAEKKTTRTAPAFHSLTAGEAATAHEARKVGESKKGSDGSDYLYTDEGDSDGDDDENVIADRKRRATPPVPRASISSDQPGAVPGEFNDISDIFNHLSNHFDPDGEPDRLPTHPSSRGSSPIVSHADTNPNTQSESIFVHSELTPQPHQHQASSSSHASLTPYTHPSVPNLMGKKSKKVKETPVEKPPKDKGPQFHTCDDLSCRKTFSRKSDLARHMRIHTGERPFVCSHNGCGKTFIQRSALQVHLRVHTGEKPHSCEYPSCGKTFGDSSSLARHRRTHTGKRPYKCEEPDCEKTFTRRTTLTAHMRSHDAGWAPDPIHYSYKRRKIGDEDDDRELEESVRTITALLAHNDGNGNIQTSEDSGSSEEHPLGARVASISAEIAAAIAHAQSRLYNEDDDDDDEEDDESGQGMEGPETVGPNISGIRGDDGLRDGTGILEVDDDDGDDDSDAFPIPLRTRKGKEALTLVGVKRKR